MLSVAVALDQQASMRPPRIPKPERTPEHEFVLGHTKGRRCLILGGQPSDRISNDLKASLEFSEVTWPECRRGASFDKVRPFIPRYDFMLLKVMQLTHVKAPMCRAEAKQHGVNIINNDSDGISRTIQNFFDHLSSHAPEKPVAPTPAPPSDDEWAAKILARIERTEDGLARSEITNAYKNSLPAQRVLELLTGLEQSGRISKRLVPVSKGRPKEVWDVAGAAEPPAIEAAPAEPEEVQAETPVAIAEPSLNLEELKRVRAHMLSQKEPVEAELQQMDAEETAIQTRLLAIAGRREAIEHDSKTLAERIYAIDQLLMVFGE